MRYFDVDPEVAGGWGNNIVADRSVHPPVVTHLHHEFYGWLGDVLLHCFPSFIVTGEAKEKLLEISATGIRFANVEITTSGEFDDFFPDMRLPKFVWLQVFGKPGKDDFGIGAKHHLIISERALDVLKKLQLTMAVIEPFEGAVPG